MDDGRESLSPSYRKYPLGMVGRDCAIPRVDHEHPPSLTGDYGKDLIQSEFPESDSGLRQTVDCGKVAGQGRDAIEVVM